MKRFIFNMVEVISGVLFIISGIISSSVFMAVNNDGFIDVISGVESPVTTAVPMFIGIVLIILGLVNIGRHLKSEKDAEKK